MARFGEYSSPHLSTWMLPFAPFRCLLSARRMTRPLRDQKWCSIGGSDKLAKAPRRATDGLGVLAEIRPVFGGSEYFTDELVAVQTGHVVIRAQVRGCSKLLWFIDELLLCRLPNTIQGNTSMSNVDLRTVRGFGQQWRDFDQSTIIQTSLSAFSTSTFPSSLGQVQRE